MFKNIPEQAPLPSNVAAPPNSSHNDNPCDPNDILVDFGMELQICYTTTGGWADNNADSCMNCARLLCAHASGHCRETPFRYPKPRAEAFTKTMRVTDRNDFAIVRFSTDDLPEKDRA